jgi:hypothetical protein
MGINVVQLRHSKIFGLEWKCQIFVVDSAKREDLITVVTCKSPTGNDITPHISQK